MLLTRSPLGHPPEGGASLDLHVLSTPPAFVLSQDQTLREGLLTCPTGIRPVCRHRKSPSLPTAQSLVHPSWAVRSSKRSHLARCTKGISFASQREARRELALTFGTLLSSQGADAHRRGPFRQVGGNPRYITWSVSRGQTRPASPRDAGWCPPELAGPGHVPVRSSASSADNIKCS